MVGLSIVLETTNNNNTVSNGVISPKPHQVISKTTVNVTNALVSASATNILNLRRGSFKKNSGFLEHCFLCRRKLLPAKDIYMYKGDRAFCCMECRSKQMSMDEEQSFTTEYCLLKMKSDSPTPSRYSGDSRNRAGGFAY